MEKDRFARVVKTIFALLVILELGWLGWRAREEPVAPPSSGATTGGVHRAAYNPAGAALPVQVPAAVSTASLSNQSADPNTGAQWVALANLYDGGFISTEEQLAAQAEDNVNGVLALAFRPLATNTYAPSLFTNFAANATLNVKPSAGTVIGIACTNANAAIRYIQIHNTATTPGGAAVPLLSFAVPASGGQTVIGADVLSFNGVYFSTGIAFAFSTTLGTYTAGSAADQNTTVVFK